MKTYPIKLTAHYYSSKTIFLKNYTKNSNFQIYPVALSMMHIIPIFFYTQLHTIWEINYNCKAKMTNTECASLLTATVTICPMSQQSLLIHNFKKNQILALLQWTPHSSYIWINIKCDNLLTKVHCILKTFEAMRDKPWYAVSSIH